MMISHFDIYNGIEIDPIGINVSKGDFPFPEGQKFLRGTKKFKAVEFDFEHGRWVLDNEKIITHVTFETIQHPVERFKVPIPQVLDSIKQGRTKFSL